MALYYIGADKEVLQAEIMSAGAVPGAVKLCSSSHPEIQAEAADLLKVRVAGKCALLIWDSVPSTLARRLSSGI